ncbi:MAG: AAA family ATPase [Bacillota bacterium]
MKLMRSLIRMLKSGYMNLKKRIDDYLNDAYDFESEELGTNDFDEVRLKDSDIGRLVGMAELKKEILLFKQYSKKSRQLLWGSLNKRVFPYHYFFNIETGMGLSTALRAFLNALNKEGLIRGKEVMEFSGKLTLDMDLESLIAQDVFLRGKDGTVKVNGKYGVIALSMEKYTDVFSEKLSDFIRLMWKERGNVVFVLTFHSDNKEIKSQIGRIEKKLNMRKISFQPYTHEELFTIAASLAEKSGLELDADVGRKLMEYINIQNNTGVFENIKSIQMAFEKIKLNKLMDPKIDSDIKTITLQDFQKLNDKADISESSVVEELDQIIGLENVKQQLKEIVANAKFQKRLGQLGIKDEKSCYHMIFTGNPGTGKTTVARVLGRLFKEIGILKNGELFEVSRDGLVAKFVGQTAPKVIEKVNESLGSVLFIDEAYSLYSGTDRQDYGYEALDALIKEMENRREELIIIMAGYPDEMEKLLNMNPGLADRVPYKIHFDDYDPDELTRIFLKQMGEKYLYEPGVIERIKEIFMFECVNKGRSFGNGRLARNIAEKLKLKHSMNICESHTYNCSDMLTISYKDVKDLYNDKTFRSNYCSCNTRKIGFV